MLVNIVREMKQAPGHPGFQASLGDLGLSIGRQAKNRVPTHGVLLLFSRKRKINYRNQKIAHSPVDSLYPRSKSK